MSHATTMTATTRGAGPAVRLRSDASSDLSLRGGCPPFRRVPNGLVPGRGAPFPPPPAPGAARPRPAGVAALSTAAGSGAAQNLAGAPDVQRKKKERRERVGRGNGPHTPGEHLLFPPPNPPLQPSLPRTPSAPPKIFVLHEAPEGRRSAPPAPGQQPPPASPPQALCDSETPRVRGGGRACPLALRRPGGGWPGQAGARRPLGVEVEGAAASERERAIRRWRSRPTC